MTWQGFLAIVVVCFTILVALGIVLDYKKGQK